jgi:hypothetical protein
MAEELTERQKRIVAKYDRKVAQFLKRMDKNMTTEEFWKKMEAMREKMRKEFNEVN